MNKDIRLLISFKNHRKRKKLKLLLGDGAVVSLVDLWLTVAEDRPDGILSGWDALDIALAAGWEGDHERFVSVLVDDCGFIDVDSGGNYRMHDWEDHQPWAIDAIERSQRAKVGALIKHHGKVEGLRRAREVHHIDTSRLGYAESLPDSAGSMPVAENGSADSMPPACRKKKTAVPNDCRRDAPSPSPSPSPLPKNLKESSPPAGSGPKGADVSKAKGHWSEHVGRWFQEIKDNGAKLQHLATETKKNFNPWQMVQQMVNEKYHPGAVSEITGKLVAYWPNIDGNPYQYVSAFKKTVKQNWNEKESIEIHQHFKNMDPGELAELTKGLFNQL